MSANLPSSTEESVLKTLKNSMMHYQIMMKQSRFPRILMLRISIISKEIVFLNLTDTMKLLLNMTKLSNCPQFTHQALISRKVLPTPT